MPGRFSLFNVTLRGLVAGAGAGIRFTLFTGPSIVISSSYCPSGSLKEQKLGNRCLEISAWDTPTLDSVLNILLNVFLFLPLLTGSAQNPLVPDTACGGLGCLVDTTQQPVVYCSFAVYNQFTMLPLSE